MCQENNAIIERLGEIVDRDGAFEALDDAELKRFESWMEELEALMTQVPTGP